MAGPGRMPRLPGSAGIRKDNRRWHRDGTRLGIGVLEGARVIVCVGEGADCGGKSGGQCPRNGTGRLLAVLKGKLSEVGEEKLPAVRLGEDRQSPNNLRGDRTRINSTRGGRSRQNCRRTGSNQAGRKQTAKMVASSVSSSVQSKIIII